ncbi:MAG: tRNA glutamyl-Q(34) synthetase GluQRS [Polaromonas sp.]|nr:MAG: tRNA glutamyl-Q(34) synthetase GluQRS [Polaromonas sp.]
MGPTTYRGRFAPSPTGPLHAGSLVAALASWLDARAHQGQWLVRIEDVDAPRCVPGVDQTIFAQLAAVGLYPDEAPLYQSQRSTAYQDALDQLVTQGLAFACGCTRQDIAQALAASGQARQRHGERVYPGTCRHGLHGRGARAWRFLTENSQQKVPPPQLTQGLGAIDSIANQALHWPDRRLGAQSQNVSQAVGDFVLKRADGLWAYQLAVVVDDAAQGITHVVRGQDLLDNTARQIMLQQALCLPTPQYLHTPLVLGGNGDKLSKQNGASAVDTTHPVTALQQAGQILGLAANLHADTPAEWLRQAVPLWADQHLKIRA